MPRPRQDGEGRRWEDTNRRVTFYCPEDVREQLDAEAAASGRSTSRVIVDALRAELARAKKRNERREA